MDVYKYGGQTTFFFYIVLDKWHTAIITEQELHHLIGVKTMMISMSEVLAIEFNLM